MKLEELPQVDCSEISEAVKRFGLYLIYKGREAEVEDAPDVRLFFERDELFMLGSMLVQHVNCSGESS